MIRRSSGRVIASVLLLALIIAGFAYGPTLVFWLTNTREAWRTAEHIGIVTKHRQGGAMFDSQVTYHAISGFMLSDIRMKPSQATHWNPDGSLWYQVGESREMNEGPEWWWGASPQRKPSAPWVKRGMSADVWWEKVHASSSRDASR